MAEFEQDVVGDVDDVIDRAQAAGLEAAAQPERALADLHALDEAAGVARALVGAGTLSLTRLSMRVSISFGRGLGG